ncbi:hypothetical protein D3C87_1049920 [compost metagenome]
MKGAEHKEFESYAAASERTAHSFVDVETFHEDLRKHTLNHHFSGIKIFVPSDVYDTLYRQLVEAPEDEDSRITVDEQHQADNFGYVFSYRKMPVITDEILNQSARFLPPSSYIVAYYPTNNG